MTVYVWLLQKWSKGKKKEKFKLKRGEVKEKNLEGNLLKLVLFSILITQYHRNGSLCVKF